MYKNSNRFILEELTGIVNYVTSYQNKEECFKIQCGKERRN